MKTQRGIHIKNAKKKFFNAKALMVLSAGSVRVKMVLAMILKIRNTINM